MVKYFSLCRPGGFCTRCNPIAWHCERSWQKPTLTNMKARGKGNGFAGGPSMRLRALLVCVLISLSMAPRLPAQEDGEKAAKLFESGMRLLMGTSQSQDALGGVSKIQDSARLGYVPAQMAMAYFAQTGTDLVPADARAAADWCKKAAEQGDALGQWCLGQAYYVGGGLSRDLRNAERWLRSAAEQGNPFAAYVLGLVEEELDYNAAPQWFLQAAEAGLPEAQKKYGLLLKEGRGITRDKYEAYVWLLIAAEADVPGLTQPLQELEVDLGSAAVDRAKDDVRQRLREVSRSAVARGCTGWDGEFATPPTLPPPDVQKFCR
jgi:hypothetical protein